ncbi:HIT family protein [Mycobacteroides salmoniphilum]|uniref:HIT-like protein n=1 Tax=Mycobacteroides salmoniphilum TaxID=404941 RepID=A0A4R8SKL7_9MYCO|nr:HIT family protein [Mycobacteroides salmoniphilum]TDZ97747.1 HIT-like protein [Mycobacteroides salmoniphilum]TEA01977.1 HIT-like protein [Mycobacteroides salmoniphilum]
MSCAFCAIVAGESPSFRVYEDEATLAFLDIRPITRGHTLVIPKAHAQDLVDLKPDDAAAIMTVGQRIANAIRGSELRSDGTNLALNDGRVAFQTVMHAHLHVVPRHGGDKLAFAKGFVVRRDPDLEGTARIIREAVHAD